MAPKPILYFSFEQILGAAFQLAKPLHPVMVISIGNNAKGKGLKLGSLEVGQCIDFEIDTISERIGFIIEWNDNIQISRQL